jgi:uncharacterized protein YebE (UPF0316 family)
MESAIAEKLGISPEVFHWFIVPLLIFTARICDVSINTLRVIFMLNGRRAIATILGFFESGIWLMAISQILQNVTSVFSYVAYAGGFATGILVGMIIEERLALGKVILRIITQKDAHILIQALLAKGYGVTYLDAMGSQGAVNVIFTVADRKKLDRLISVIEEHNPGAFYTIEAIKFVSKNYEQNTDPLIKSPFLIRWISRK